MDKEKPMKTAPIVLSRLILAKDKLAIFNEGVAKRERVDSCKER
jgi:hypothetical protein